jgi:hypothetical protein
MAIKAIFVGINKHLDAAIPELSGAQRDAMALWALFTRQHRRFGGAVKAEARRSKLMLRENEGEK